MAKRVVGVDPHVDPAHQLAADESMLLAAQDGDAPDLVRVWEFDRPALVLGRSSRVDYEVDRQACERLGVPIQRRCSGGASVVGGPGCLMYSVVLAMHRQPELQKIDVAHRHVMARVLQAVHRQLSDVQKPDANIQGICDLTWRGRKCSGNSLRITRSHLLYHGTILYDFDLELLASCLANAPRQPEYRAGRDHGSFVTNVPIDPIRFADDLCDEFGVDGHWDAALLADRIEALRRQRYDDRSWTYRH